MIDGRVNILIVDDKPDKVLSLEALLEDLGQALGGEVQKDASAAASAAAVARADGASASAAARATVASKGDAGAVAA